MTPVRLPCTLSHHKYGMSYFSGGPVLYTPPLVNLSLSLPWSICVTYPKPELETLIVVILVAVDEYMSVMPVPFPLVVMDELDIHLSVVAVMVPSRPFPAW